MTDPANLQTRTLLDDLEHALGAGAAALARSLGHVRRLQLAETICAPDPTAPPAATCAPTGERFMLLADDRVLTYRPTFAQAQHAALLHFERTGHAVTVVRIVATILAAEADSGGDQHAHP